MSTMQAPAAHTLSTIEVFYLHDAAANLRQTGDDTAYAMADHLDTCADTGTIPTDDMDTARDAGVVFDGDE